MDTECERDAFASGHFPRWAWVTEEWVHDTLAWAGAELPQLIASEAKSAEPNTIPPPAFRAVVRADQYMSVLRILSLLESIAIAIEQEHIQEEPIRQSLGLIILGAWATLQDFVFAQRQLTGPACPCSHLEALAKKWKDTPEGEGALRVARLRRLTARLFAQPRKTAGEQQTEGANSET